MLRTRTFDKTMVQPSLVGIPLIILAMLIFQLSDNLVKHLSQSIALLPLTFYRCLVAGVFILVVLGWRRQLQQLRSPHVGHHLGRIVLMVVLNLSYVLMLKELPISVVSTAYCATPLLINALAPLILKEAVSFKQWLATLLGFGGCLLVIQPDFGNLTLGMAVALLQPLLYGCLLLLSKYLTDRGESTWILNFYSFLPTALILAPFTLGEGLNLDTTTHLLIIVSALAAVAAFALLFFAFSLGRAAVLAPFEYSAILFALLSDIIVWHFTPNPLLFVGVVCVFACGYMQFKEAQSDSKMLSAHANPQDIHRDGR